MGEMTVDEAIVAEAVSSLLRVCVGQGEGAGVGSTEGRAVGFGEGLGEGMKVGSGLGMTVGLLDG